MCVGSIQIAGQSQSPRGSFALTSSRPNRGSRLMRVRSLPEATGCRMVYCGAPSSISGTENQSPAWWKQPPACVQRASGQRPLAQVCVDMSMTLYRCIHMFSQSGICASPVTLSKHGLEWLLV